VFLNNSWIIVDGYFTGMNAICILMENPPKKATERKNLSETVRQGEEGYFRCGRLKSTRWTRIDGETTLGGSTQKPLISIALKKNKNRYEYRVSEL